MVNAFEIDKIILTGKRGYALWILQLITIDDTSQSEALLMVKDTGVIAGIDIAKGFLKLWTKCSF